MAKKIKAGADAVIYLILDKSGSMYAIQQATIDGVNKFVFETAKTSPEAQYHASLFDTQVTKICSGVPLRSVEPLTSQAYRPDGNTALLDAIGRAVKDIDELPEKPNKVVIVIMTDGAENASHEYTRAAINSLIEDREKDNWQFLFLGANLDSFAEAGAIGMRNAGSTSATWQPTYRGTQAVYAAVTDSVGNFLGGTARSATLTQDQYDQTLASLPKDTPATPEPKQPRARGVSRGIINKA